MINQALTFRFPLYQSGSFVGYVRLTSAEKGQLTRNHCLVYRVGTDKRMYGKSKAALWDLCLDLIENTTYITLSDQETRSGKPMAVIRASEPLHKLPTDSRLIFTDSITERRIAQ